MQRRDFLIFASLLVAGCASQPASKPVASGLRFADAERKLITDFFTQQRAGSPVKVVPAQGVKAGDVLDSGLRPNKLPSELLKSLPDLPEPYTRLTLGADVILVNRNTHAILDVIPRIAY